MVKLDQKDAYLCIRIANEHMTAQIQVEPYAVQISGVTFRVSVGTKTFHKHFETTKWILLKTSHSLPNVSGQPDYSQSEYDCRPQFHHLSYSI